MYTILLVIHTVIVVFLIFMVLIQRTDSDGLSGLSGGGGNQFLTGRAQANLLTRTTAILATLFMITSLTLAIMASHMTATSIIDTVTPAEGVLTGAPVEKAVEQKPSVTQPAKATPTPMVPKPE